MRQISEKEFLDLLGADFSFILMNKREKDTEFLPYNEKLLEKLLDNNNNNLRISTGGKIEGAKYFDLQTAYKTKVLAIIDIDSFEDTKIFNFLKETIPPSLKLKTNRGWHYLYLTQKEIKLRESDTEKDTTEYYDKFFFLKQLLRKATIKLKEIDKNVDKIDTLIYTRISDEIYSFDKFYDFDEFVEKIKEIFNIDDVELDTINEHKVVIVKEPANDFKGYVLNAHNYCGELKYIMENPESHNYFEWNVFARHMVNLYILGFEWAKEKFHELASRHADYKERQNEKLFEHYLEKGFAFLSCKILKSIRGEACKTCPNRSGTPYLYRDIFLLENLVEREGKFYKLLSSREGYL
ncbi:MAG: hypothetical protein NC925_02580, partial [Candidatus Omnitrophica bacterium]|nr:hypothetical protein [Candidatus Omnitrophota bacterium]